MEVWNPRVGEVTRLVVFEKWRAFFFPILKAEPERSKVPRSGKAHVFIKRFPALISSEFIFCFAVDRAILKPSQQRSKVWVQAFFSLSR